MCYVRISRSIILESPAKPDWEYQIDFSYREISEMSDKDEKVLFLANTGDVVEEGQ